MVAVLCFLFLIDFNINNPFNNRIYKRKNIRYLQIIKNVKTYCYFIIFVTTLRQTIFTNKIHFMGYNAQYCNGFIFYYET